MSTKATSDQRLWGSCLVNSGTEIHRLQRVSFRKEYFIIGSLGAQKKLALLYSRELSMGATPLSLNKTLLERGGRGELLSSVPMPGAHIPQGSSHILRFSWNGKRDQERNQIPLSDIPSS